MSKEPTCTLNGPMGFRYASSGLSEWLRSQEHAPTTLTTLVATALRTHAQHHPRPLPINGHDYHRRRNHR